MSLQNGAKAKQAPSMITKDNLIQLLDLLGFNTSNTAYIKQYDKFGCTIKVDVASDTITYPDGIDTGENTTTNLSQNENFVVLECVDRLLEKGYDPKTIALEKKWQLGHGGKSGRADIVVSDNFGKTMLIIECKTAGAEYNSAWRDTLEDGAQLFSYFQQERTTQFLCLYASDISNGKISNEYRLINVKDNTELLSTLTNPKSYNGAGNNKELFAAWKETYQQDNATRGLFEDDIDVYNIGKKKYTVNDLQQIDENSMQKKYNEFATILRQHNVSGHENAFDKLVNLFLAKVVDETNNPNELLFYWKGAAYDDFFRLQDRLQKLYKDGMERFLNEDVIYIDNKDIEEAFRLFKNDPDATKQTILRHIRSLKFFTNNDFAFIDVHNEHLFYQNSEVLLKMVQMLQDIKLKTDTQNQFLGDLFEGFLDQGVKQSEGQFFTPTPIVKFLISSLPLETIITENSEIPQVIDYACGAGHFLNEYAEQIKPFVERKGGKLNDYYAAITGIEKEYRLSKVSKVAAFMYGQDDIKIIYADALSRIKGVDNNKYSVLVANPPYSVKGFLETLSEEERANYSLVKAVSDTAKCNSIETFFIERAAQLLKPDGVAAIVLPTSVLSNGGIYMSCREIILQNFDIIAIACFGSGTFGKTGTNTATLFLRRKKTDPSLSEHYRNRVETWFSGDSTKDGIFEDYPLLEKYCSHIGVSVNVYKTLFNTIIKNTAGYEITESATPVAANGVGFTESIYDYDIFKEYQALFSADSKARLINNKKTSARYSELDKAAELSKYIRSSIVEIEKEKLYYFMLASDNVKPVIVVTPPSDNKENKLFLGYEWSGAKGNEGIKYLGSTTSTNEENEIERNKGIKRIMTPLFNPNNLADIEKINSVIRSNFSSETTVIPNSLSKYVSAYNLTDMLDFSRTSFDKQIRTNGISRVEVVSKYPLVKIGELLCEQSKSKIQVGTAKDVENGQYPFFTSGEQILSFNSYLVEGENIYLSTGGNAVVNFYNGNASYSTDTWVVKSNDTNKVLTKYLYLILSSITTEINEYYFKGVGLKHLQKNDLKLKKIPLPPLEIQQQIVDECNIVDTALEEATTTILECKEKIEEAYNFLDEQSINQLKLSNKEIFNISIGRRIVNSEMSPDYEIPVYSANVFEPFGKINKLLIENFSIPSVIWGIDGDWMVNVIEANIPFYPTDHCGVLRIKKNNLIDAKYMAWLLNKEGQKVGFKRSYRASIDRIESLSVKIAPFTIQQNVLSKVSQYELKIIEAKNVINSCADRKRAILDKYLQ